MKEQILSIKRGDRVRVTIEGEASSGAGDDDWLVVNDVYIPRRKITSVEIVDRAWEPKVGDEVTKEWQLVQLPERSVIARSGDFALMKHGGRWLHNSTGTGFSSDYVAASAAHRCKAIRLLRIGSDDAK